MRVREMMMMSSCARRSAVQVAAKSVAAGLVSTVAIGGVLSVGLNEETRQREWYKRYFASVEGVGGFSEALGPLKASLFAEVPRGAAIVEVGAGPGTNARLISEAKPSKYTVVDSNLYFDRDVASTSQLESQSADVVVATLLLCSVGDVDAMLLEIRRILKPGGLYVFVEHVGSEDAAYAFAQRLAKPLQRALADGCDPTLDTEAAIRGVFDIITLHRAHLPFFPVGPVIGGIGRR